MRQHLERVLRRGAGARTRRHATTAGRQRRHPGAVAARKLGREAYAGVAPGARRDRVATAHHQRAERLIDEFCDPAIGAEDLRDLDRARLGLGVAGERIFAREVVAPRLVDLRCPDAVDLALGRPHHDLERLQQRAHEQRAQRAAGAVGHAGEHLLVDHAQRVRQLGAVAFERLLDQLAAARAGVALVLQLVEARAQLRQRLEVVAHRRRVVVAHHHQPRQASELAPDRAHRNLARLAAFEVDVQVHARRRLAQDHLLEPVEHAALGLTETLVDDRRVVPRGLAKQRIHQLADRRGLRVAEPVHARHGLREVRELEHRDALHELLPLGRVLGLVHLHQRLLDLLRAALEREIVSSRGLEHPVIALQLLERGRLDRLLNVALPRFARERAADGVAAGDHFLVLIADQARHRDRREARRRARLDLAVDALARRHALDDAAQALACLVECGDVALALRERRVVGLRQRERDHAFGAADGLLARHRAAVRLEPAAPEARDLVRQVAGLQARAVRQHDVGLERVVGVLHVRRRGHAVRRLRLRRGGLRARCGGARFGADRRVGSGRRDRLGRCVHRLQLQRVAVDFAQVVFDRRAGRLEHDLGDAGEVFVAQLALDLVALIEPQRHRPRPLIAKALQLLNAVLQDLHRLQTRLQIEPVLLQLHRLVEIGLDVRHQALVADRRPGPHAQRNAERQHRAEEARIAQPQLGAARELAHQRAVGEDHLGEQVLQEEAGLRHHHRRHARVHAQPEALRDALAGAVVRLALLQRAREVEAAEHRPVLVRVVFEQRRDEAAQRRLERGELERKRQHAGRQLLATVERHARDRRFFQAFVQLIETLLELRHRVAVAIHLVRQRRAPDAVALDRVAVLKELDETRDQVGLREHQVDRREHLELLGQLLHALAQLLGQRDRDLGLAGADLAQAHRHQDAVDRRLRPVLLQQLEKAEPFFAVFLVHRVAPGRVEQDALRGEEPVAVARAADALDHAAGVVGERELQPRLDDGRALARRRVADHHVPRHLVERGSARGLAELGGLDRLDRFAQAHAQRFDLDPLARRRGLGGALGLLLDDLLQALRRLPCAPALEQPHRQPDEQEHADQHPAPHQRELQRARADEQERRQRHDADHRQRARVRQETPKPLHRMRTPGNALASGGHGGRR